jgi:hypothetical protein
MSNIIIIVNFSLFLPYFLLLAGKRVINFVIKKRGKQHKKKEMMKRLKNKKEKKRVLCVHVQRDANAPLSGLITFSLMKLLLPACKDEKVEISLPPTKGGRSAAGSPLLFLFDIQKPSSSICVHIGAALQVFNYNAHLSRGEEEEPQKEDTHRRRFGRLMSNCLPSALLCLYSFRIISEKDIQSKDDI